MHHVDASNKFDSDVPVSSLVPALSILDKFCQWSWRPECEGWIKLEFSKNIMHKNIFLQNTKINEVSKLVWILTFSICQTQNSTGCNFSICESVEFV